LYTATRFSMERFAALDRAVRAGEYPNARTLAGRLEVSRRTVLRDVEFLRDRIGVPLAFDPRRNGYYYTDPTYRLPALVLTEGELVALFLAQKVLRQYAATPYAPELARAFRKLTAGLDERVTIDMGSLDASHSFRTTAPPELDPALYRDLAAAVLGRRRVVLDYYSASRDERARREVDPYHLAVVDGQFYMIGFCHLRGDVRMFVPGRIRSLEVTAEVFEPPCDFRIDDYLAASFAVMRGGRGEEFRVRLRFTGEAVRYVRERTWHPSQAFQAEPDGGLILSLAVGHLREVERFVLSWGSDCVVLDPPELRERVARILDAAHKFYWNGEGARAKHSDRSNERTRKTPRPRPRR
jgi:predicted DNA-binding transcriptional regulator YafY